MSTRHPARVIGKRVQGRTFYVAVCRAHKKLWRNAGAAELGTHNGAHMAKAQHNREKHRRA